jgi:hypothetical protein
MAAVAKKDGRGDCFDKLSRSLYSSPHTEILERTYKAHYTELFYEYVAAYQSTLQDLEERIENNSPEEVGVNLQFIKMKPGDRIPHLFIKYESAQEASKKKTVRAEAQTISCSFLHMALHSKEVLKEKDSRRPITLLFGGSKATAERIVAYVEQQAPFQFLNNEEAFWVHRFAEEYGMKGLATRALLRSQHFSLTQWSPSELMAPEELSHQFDETAAKNRPTIYLHAVDDIRKCYEQVLRRFKPLKETAVEDEDSVGGN